MAAPNWSVVTSGSRRVWPASYGTDWPVLRRPGVITIRDENDSVVSAAPHAGNLRVPVFRRHRRLQDRPRGVRGHEGDRRLSPPGVGTMGCPQRMDHERHGTVRPADTDT